MFLYFFVFPRVLINILTNLLVKTGLNLKIILFWQWNFFQFKRTLFRCEEFLVDHVFIDTIFECYSSQIFLFEQKYIHQDQRIRLNFLFGKFRILAEIKMANEFVKLDLFCKNLKVLGPEVFNDFITLFSTNRNCKIVSFLSKVLEMRLH